MPRHACPSLATAPLAAVLAAVLAVVSGCAKGGSGGSDVGAAELGTGSADASATVASFGASSSESSSSTTAPCEPTTWFLDLDADGHGDPATMSDACPMPEGAVDLGDDCDDAEPERHPEHAEICDALDNDCDALVDEASADNPECGMCKLAVSGLDATVGYAFCPTVMNRNDARNTCIGKGGDLVTLADEAELQALIAAAPPLPEWPGYAIGLDDTLVEGDFRWIDGSASMLRFPWDAGQPDSSGGDEDCVETYFPVPKWNDVGCAVLRPFVCELPA
ncbi:MAG: hypothetical protein K1X88_01100 [Nannocystaceae bacterium]|nr:hypothetical protein [Nannocystaceae bacterium]